MKMIKRYAGILMMLTLLVGFTSCESEEETEFNLPGEWYTNEEIDFWVYPTTASDLSLVTTNSSQNINNFSEIISNSKTVIWSGAMGFYEQENCRMGTQKIAQAVANSLGQKIIAGGDTSASIKDLGTKCFGITKIEDTNYFLKLLDIVKINDI